MLNKQRIQDSIFVFEYKKDAALRRSIIIQIIASLLILLFLYAATSKMLSYGLFAAQLYTHPYLKHLAGILAWAVPAVEITIVVFLAIPGARLIGLYGSAIVLGVFTLYLGVMLTFQSNLPCSCGGIISGMSWGGHILFNLAFLAISGLGIRLLKGKYKS